MATPFFRIKMISKGKNPLEFIKDVQAIAYPEIQRELFELGDETAVKMKEVVISGRKRADKGTNKLEKSITSEVLNRDAGISIGIGNISKMTQEASYWEMINDGGSYVTSKTFVPPPFEDGEFRTFKAGSKHTIEGIDYVGIAAKELRNKLETVTKDWIVQQIEKQSK